MPETIGLLALQAVGVTEIAGFAITGATASIVGNVVLASALVGANLLLNQQKGPSPQDGQLVTRQSLPARRRYYGLVKIAGPLLFSETRQGVRFQVIALNQGEISEFVDHWMSDTHVVLDDSGRVTNAFLIGSQYFVTINTDVGTDDTEAFSTLLAIFPDLWTSAHQGKGIAKVLTATAQPKSSDFTKVYNGGQPPSYRAVVRASKVWDPRDHTQSRNDKSTWKYSANAVLQILDYHRHADGMGLAQYDDALFPDIAIAEDWIPSANICDESMLRKDGTTEARYECSGGYALSDAPKTVLAAMFATCDGQTFQRSDGAIGIRVGKSVAPTVTISAEHILSYDGMRRGPPDSLIPVNQVTAKYTARNLDYQQQDADAWRDEDAISAAGREETRDIDLSWVGSHSQARRLMKIAFARFTPEWSGRITTDLDGIRAYSERYINVEIPELGISGSFEIAPGSFSIDVTEMTCTMAISSMSQSAFNWSAAADEGDEPQAPEANDDEDDIDAPDGLATSVVSHKISISWDAPSRVDLVPVAQYSVHGDDNWLDAPINSDGISADTPTLSAGTYDVQVYFVTGTRQGSVAAHPNIVVT